MTPRLRISVLPRLLHLRLLLKLCLGIMFAAAAGSALAQSPSPQPGGIIVIDLDGAIGPASAAHVSSGLERASEEKAELVVIRMDTPGGLDTSMREIIREILAMDVPVASYVHPSGARAASAGTYILYASHVAAMTPGTNLGAATPIQLGGEQPRDGEDNEGQPAPASAHERKAVNDAVAYIRSLAEMRGRNADWAEEAVRDAASLSADAALAEGVIDIVAPNLESLLEQLDGVTVTIAGQDRQLVTAGKQVTEIEPSWSTRMLATITDPNIAMLLMMIGIYGLIFEFMNPGALVPGIVGSIALLVALYALAALPVNFVGVALIVLGVGLLAAEAFAPSFGVLGAGGLASFVIGAAIMFDTDVPEFQLDWTVIAAIAVFGAVLLVLIARLGLSSFRRPIVTGQEEMLGAGGEIIDWSGRRGHVFVHSERWEAAGPEGLEKGGRIIVTGVNGLQLTVAAAETEQDIQGEIDGHARRY